MKKQDVINQILGDRLENLANPLLVKAFAPTNIALCKYWGKRDQELNLPVTSSLSISLGSKGTSTELCLNEQAQDIFMLNGEVMSLSSNFSRRLESFLDLFRGRHSWHFRVETKTNIPLAAGLASSASGFAALVLALNKLFDWQLDSHQLSILARLGSGSACRSLWPGFVEWSKGIERSGMDSYGKEISAVWAELCIGLLMVNENEKPISSREAMQRTVDTNMFYSLWPEKVNQDLVAIKKAIDEKDFLLLGKTAESNALTMHSLMLSAWPPIQYALPETVAVTQKIWALRQQGIAVYFTQDAGPNLKLLFLSADAALIQSHFPTLEIIKPFETSSSLE
ncbi:MAG: ispE [Gammaproteobacteria bacterium]|nr:ispE [Gammaproteobacteria bacterium]